MLSFAEVANDNRMNSLPRPVGEKQHGQSGHSQKTDHGLKLENLASAKPLHHLGKNADDQEVSADDQNRQRRSQDGQRGIHVDLGQSGSSVGNYQEDAP